MTGHCAERLIIHAGFPKTGTTSIQNALHRNKDVLYRNCSVLYPGTAQNHSLLVNNGFKGDPTKVIQNRIAGRSSVDEIRAAAETLRRKIDTEINQLRPQTLVFSSEAISNLRLADLGAFRDWVARYAKEVSILYVVRHPLPYATSICQQLQKQGTTIADFSTGLYSLDFSGRIRNGIETFGRDNTRVHVFEEMCTANGGIVGAFVDLLGVDDPTLRQTLVTDNKIDNPSLTQPASDLLDALNRQRPAFVDGVKGPKRTLDETSHFRKISGRKFTLPPDTARRVMEKAVIDLGKLRLISGIDPYPDLDTQPPPQGPTGAFDEIAIESVAELLVDLHAKLKRPVKTTPIAAPASLFTRMRDKFRAGMTRQVRARRIILHAGLGKTGTTSIQAALFDAKAHLLTQGILYPGAMRDHNTLIGNAFFSDPRQFPLNQMRDRTDLAALVAGGKAMRDAIVAEVRQTCPDTIVISSESTVSSQVDLAALSDWLGMLGQSVEVVLVIRDPLQQVTSLAQQHLKGGRTLADIHSAPPPSDICGHLDRLVGAFGKERVTVLRFEDLVAAPSGMARAFLEAVNVGAGVLGAAKAEAVWNTSLSYPAALLLDAMNRQRPAFLEGGQRNPNRPMNEVQRLMRVSGPKFALPAAVSRQIIAQAREDLARLNDRHGLDPYPDFGRSIPPEPPEVPFRQETVESLALVLSDLIFALHSQNENAASQAGKKRR